MGAFEGWLRGAAITPQAVDVCTVGACWTQLKQGLCVRRSFFAGPSVYACVMPTLTTPQRSPALIQLHRADALVVRAELTAGLLGGAAHIAPKYLYDALGSRLFAAITELAEYYPTRIEAEILARYATDIARGLPTGATLVDLGAGNCEKAARLFGALKPARYVAVDISVDFLQQALQCLQREHPALELLGIGLDFSSQLALPPEVGAGPRVVFYPGSSIGNFAPVQALDFLRQAREVSQGGALLIGVDLVKPVSVLEPAYDDALGVTAAFNRNMLLHLNHLLGSNFDIAHWRHRARFDAAHSRIEMYLDATQDQLVQWPGAQRLFRRGESIHTENSYKYSVAGFEALLGEAGFTGTRCWTDARNWFAVFTAEAGGEPT